MPNKQKYFENTYIGPYNVYMVKCVDKKTHAEFICPYCGQHFIASASDVNAGKVRSCGCFRKKVASNSANEYLDSIRKNLVGKNLESY